LRRWRRILDGALHLEGLAAEHAAVVVEGVDHADANGDTLSVALDLLEFHELGVEHRHEPAHRLAQAHLVEELPGQGAA
jgi:hypothetical protein